MISELGLTFTLNDCNPPVPYCSSVQLFRACQIISYVCKKFQVGCDTPSNDYVLNIYNHPYQCNAYVYLNSCRQENCYK